MKAQGPDGFHANFYQKAWDIVGDNISSHTIRILEGGELNQAMAEALLVLIPKTERPETIKNFRPISLCNVSFKLVTKVIVTC